MTGRPHAEPDRVALRPLLIASGAVLAVLVAAHLVIGAWLDRGPSPESPTGNAATASEDFAALRARQREHLERTGWVDRRNGIAHIPVERAMELLVEDRVLRSGTENAGTANRNDEDPR
ncbi:MAG: hypothetical protein R3323_02020 [Wenzhouxiangellaceae bacterium]|nr:hypothetical protein [Wenzhouxiangellaceae bacterium]